MSVHVNFPQIDISGVYFVTRSEIKTLELLDEDHTIDDIAKERELSRGTIESHVIRIVKNGFYEASDFISKEHYEIMEEYFEETNDKSISSARDVLGEEFSYFELKLMTL